MEPGHRRTMIARVAAGLGTLCGANALLAAITNDFVLGLKPHGWGIGGIPVGTDWYFSSVRRHRVVWKTWTDCGS